MAGRRSEPRTYRDAAVARSARRVGRRCRRAGAVLGGLSLVIAVAVFPTLVADGPVGTAARIGAVMRADAAALGGAELAFHLAALGALAGCWLFGLGLVLSGLFDGAE